MKYISVAVLALNAPYFIAFLVGNQKLKRLNQIFYIGFMILITNLLKLINADPRPYMVDSKIKPVTETLGGGHPSGHAIFAYFLFAWVCEEFCLNGRKFYGAQKGYNNNYGLKSSLLNKGGALNYEIDEES